MIKSQSDLLNVFKNNNIKIDTSFFSFNNLRNGMDYLTLSNEDLNFLIYLDALKKRFDYKIIHFYGHGVDIDPMLDNLVKMDDETKKFIINSFQGVGFYKTHIHLDWRIEKIYWVGKDKMNILFRDFNSAFLFFEKELVA